MKHERDIGELVEAARVSDYERGFEDGVRHALDQFKNSFDKYGVLDAAKIAAAVGMLA